MFTMVELLKDSFNLESQTLSPQLKEKVSYAIKSFAFLVICISYMRVFLKKY